MRKEYTHEGWTGPPYHSDFMARWGLIEQAEILNLEGCKGKTKAVELCRSKGFSYFVWHAPGLQGNRLYKVSGNSAVCIYRWLVHMERHADRTAHRYRTSIEKRVEQILRSAEQRAKAKGTGFDLRYEDILARVIAGRCEATGAGLNLEEVNSGFAPSLDQIVPGAGYTHGNVQIVCMMFNMMKGRFPPEEVTAFVAALKGLPPDSDRLFA